MTTEAKSKASREATILMIEKCMRYNADHSRVLGDYNGPVHHHRAECEGIAEHQKGNGPNLLLWTGSGHKLVLTLKL